MRRSRCYVHGCDGVLAKVSKAHDFGAYGLASLVAPGARVLRCGRCGTIHGPTAAEEWRLARLVIPSLLEQPALDAAQTRFLRIMMGLSQERLARRLGISREHLLRSERGRERLSPAVERLLRLLALEWTGRIKGVVAFLDGLAA